MPRCAGGVPGGLPRTAAPTDLVSVDVFESVQQAEVDSEESAVGETLGQGTALQRRQQHRLRHRQPGRAARELTGQGPPVTSDKSSWLCVVSYNYCAINVCPAVRKCQSMK